MLYLLIPCIRYRRHNEKVRHSSMVFAIFNRIAHYIPLKKMTIMVEERKVCLMYRKLFLIGLFMLLSLVSCARNEQRPKAYDEHVCPICTQNPGTCIACNNTGKCSYCHGTGKRVTGWPADDAEKIKKGSYTEACPFCKATGVCGYCNGAKQCWACKGKGTVESWSFYQ